MGWYETKLYQSAEPQFKETAVAILNDPYLMPPSPLFWTVFDDLANGERETAIRHITGILEDIVWNIHTCIKQDGDPDAEINLLEFWKHLLREGEKNGYSFFQKEGVCPYITGYNECCGRFAPICIWARSIYLASIQVTETYFKGLGEYE